MDKYISTSFNPFETVYKLTLFLPDILPTHVLLHSNKSKECYCDLWLIECSKLIILLSGRDILFILTDDSKLKPEHRLPSEYYQSHWHRRSLLSEIIVNDLVCSIQKLYFLCTLQIRHHAMWLNNRERDWNGITIYIKPKQKLIKFENITK